MGRQNGVNWWTRQTEVPPYEVVGPLERADERDIVGNRAALVPGSPHYVAYYAAHPERERIDARFRIYPTKESQFRKRAAVHRRHPVGFALAEADGVGALASRYQAGPVAPRQVEMEPHVAAQNIKAAARYMGAEMVGICKLNPAWVYSHSGRAAAQGDHWGEPVQVDHHYAIVVAVARSFDMALAARGYTIAADIESGQLRGKNELICIRLASYIRLLGYPAEAQTGGHNKLMVQPVAVDAGIGEMSRAALVVTKKYGPDVYLGAVTTDLPLEVDKPVDLGVRDFCSKCLKCAECCPMGAISLGDMEVVRGVRLWRFDAERCFRLRMAVGDTHICMHCMSVCPWTKPRNIIHQTAAEMAIRFPFTRRPLVWIDDFLYGRKPRQHPLPDWAEPGQRRSLKQRIVTALHKI